jgi:lipopolysaccharide/colanic/teichoic acid biosynthesis glycosyltransferase
VGRAVKRSFDIAAALFGLIVLSPLILAICIAIRWRMGGPVLFRQRRTGYRGRSFGALKFRTMNSRTDKHGNLLPDHKRVGRIGRLLRKTSLDELPQLLNVLRGEMSVIGPRPLLPKYDLWYTDRERRRFEVRPGITGLAQVAGRNTVGWSTRLHLDVDYVERRSLWLDAKILATTMRVVLVGEGVVADQRALMADLDEERSEAHTDEVVFDAEARKLLRTAS